MTDFDYIRKERLTFEEGIKYLIYSNFVKVKKCFIISFLDSYANQLFEEFNILDLDIRGNKFKLFL